MKRGCQQNDTVSPPARFWPVQRGGQGERRRGTAARVLDLLGKWSLIDGFVMVGVVGALLRSDLPHTSCRKTHMFSQPS